MAILRAGTGPAMRIMFTMLNMACGIIVAAGGHRHVKRRRVSAGALTRKVVPDV